MILLSLTPRNPRPDAKIYIHKDVSFINDPIYYADEQVAQQRCIRATAGK